MPKPGDVIAGKFRITQTLGQGGMGVVLAGEHLDLRQTVAIKVLQPALASEPDALARFLREARAAASIRSRHAVRIYDVGTTDAGVPYMVMERLVGVGVDALVDQGPLPVHRAVELVLEAAEAIAEANALGIVHRDIKPANLFLAEDGAGPAIVKVLDFGISKVLRTDDVPPSASLTAPQTLLGSPKYMSPEQLRDPSSVDARTDVWGLGVTLYELLTGRVPFRSHSIPELCALIFNATPDAIDTLRPEVPPALADLVRRCLAKDPGARVPDVATLASELGAIRTTLAEPFARTVRDGVSLAVAAEPNVATSRRSARVAVTMGVLALAGLGLGVGWVARAQRRPVDVPRERNAASVRPAPVASAPPLPDSARTAEDASPPVASATPPAPSSPPQKPHGLKSIKLLE